MRLVDPRAKRPWKTVVEVRGNNEARDRQAHLSCRVTRENVTEISRRHGEGNGAMRRAEAHGRSEVIGDLREDAGEVDRVDTCQPKRIAQLSRLRDLTIVPVPDGDFVDQWLAEIVIFESGRPTLVIPNSRRIDHVHTLNTVAIAWDSSRTAARAVADCMPLLQKANNVRVVTVLNEKNMHSEQPGSELSNYLARHDVATVVDELDSAGRDIGETLKAYIARQKVDVLVMGAYGHSRVREYVMGGATRTVLDTMTVPVLMSH